MAPPSLRPPPRPREHPPLPRTPPSIGREPAAGDGRDARPRRAPAAGPGDDGQRRHRAGRVVPSRAAAADRDRGPRRRRGRRSLDLRPGRREARPRCASDRARRGHRTEHRADRRPPLVAGLPRRGGPVPAVRHLEAVWRAGGSGAARRNRRGGGRRDRRPYQLRLPPARTVGRTARRTVHLMRVEIVTIGYEVLSGRTLDTNFAWLARGLEEAAVQVAWHTTTGD